MHSVCYVAFWFTRRADSFRLFWYPERYEPQVNSVELSGRLKNQQMGMDPALILDDKSKEKALAEEMMKKYGTTRGTRGIIIKQINNPTTQLGENILACKLLRT
jgi:hypothetical protein